MNDGGTAFPASRLEKNPLHDALSSDSVPLMLVADYPGMSLRDWFAGQAIERLMLQGSLSSSPDAVARFAYDVADAMLKAREQA